MNNMDGVRKIEPENINLSLQNEIKKNKKIMAQLEFLNKQNQILLHSLPDSILIVNKNGTCLEFYPGTNITFLKATDRLVGKNLNRILPKQQAKKFRFYVFKTLHSRKFQIWNFDNTIENEKHFFEVRSVFVQFDRVLMIIRDITEQRRVEKSLKESELKFRNLVETSQDLIWKCDNEGMLIYLNPTWELTHGYTIDEMLGKQFRDFQTNKIYERDRIEFEKHLKKGIIKGYQTTHITKSGKVLDLLFNAIPLLTKKGEIIGTQGTAYDITDKLRTKKQLLGSELKYQDLINTSPLGIFVSQDNLLKIVNPVFAQIFGYDGVDELYNKSIIELIAPVYQKNLSDKLRLKLNRESNIESIETTAIRKDYAQVQISIKIKTIEFEGKKSIFGFVEDISETLRLQEQNEQALKLESLGILAGGIAHDFNNIIVGIMGNASIGLGKVEPNSELATLFNKIEYSSIKASDLSNQMLAYSGKSLISLTTQDINLIIAETVQLLDIPENKSVNIKLNFSSDESIVDIDTTMIRQILINLIQNAIDAIHQNDGIIEITSKILEISSDFCNKNLLCNNLHPGKSVIIKIKDNGVGIERSILSKIFDPFFTTKFTGRGLGLAVVLGNINSLKGCLKVHSNVGKGTIFEIIFPYSNNSIVHEIKEIETEIENNNSKSILICDDEKIVREVIDNMLSEEGFTVKQASTGIEAINIVNEEHSTLDLIILDLSMPIMSGDEVFLKIKEINPNIPIIIMSGYTEYDIEKKFIEKDFNEFLPKPFTFQSLLSCVFKVINN